MVGEGVVTYSGIYTLPKSGQLSVTSEWLLDLFHNEYKFYTSPKHISVYAPETCTIVIITGLTGSDTLSHHCMYDVLDVVEAKLLFSVMNINAYTVIV